MPVIKHIPLRRFLFILLVQVSIAWTLAFAGIYEDILHAANQGDTETVVSLLKRGMDVNTADTSGTTLLMIAARTNNLILLDFLLKNRANVLKRNRYGDSALMMAAMSGHAEVIRKLVNAGADVSHSGWAPIHYAAYAGKTEALSSLIEAKADLDARAPNGQTALMLAAGLGHLQVVKILIDADADMDLEDFEGRSALKLAHFGRHTDVVEFLKASGALE